MNRSILDKWMDDKVDVTSSSNLLSYQLGGRKVRYEKRVLINSTTRRLEKRRDDRWTHQFHIQVKSHQETDLPKYVKRVVFCFCEGCSSRISMVDEPPYMADGFCNIEFPVRVTLLFRDTHQTCIILHHTLRLSSQQTGTLPLEDEAEHVISFINPSTRMQKFLNEPLVGEPPKMETLNETPDENATVSNATDKHKPTEEDNLDGN